MPYFPTDLGNSNKIAQAWKMNNKYLARSNFLESVAVDNFMKTRLDKMVVIRMESIKREQNQRKLKLSS